MAGGKNGKNGNAKTQTALGFEATLWATADRLRSNMDAADYKHVVLGLIFLKFISDRFERQRAKVAATPHADPEDRDEYTSAAVFWVPKEARWAHIQASAPQPTIGETVDEAMYAIERENALLRTNNPLERLMREIRRRTRVVGAFPDGSSCLNLAAARLRHVAGTAWSSKRYLTMHPASHHAMTA